MTETSATTDRRAGVGSRSFLALLATQFLGTVNDNLLRWLAAKIGMAYAGPSYASMVLAAGLASLVVPFIVLAAPAGYLADRFSKRRVIVGCKLAEVGIMLIGMGTIAWGHPYLLLAVLAMAGAQSALFGPAKLGSIPELVRPERLSTANGIMGLVTMTAIITGTVGGYELYHLVLTLGDIGLWLSGSTLLVIALIGWLASLLIRSTPACAPERKFDWNFVAQTTRDLRTLRSVPALWRVALGSAFFWSLASLAQGNIDVFGTSQLHLHETEIGPLMGILTVGIGLGSVLAGVFSRGRVELGLVPLASTSIAICSMMLFLVPTGDGSEHLAYLWTCVWLFLLGCGSGMFDVPLQAYLQHRSPPESRGSNLAASYFLTYLGMLLASVFFALLRLPVGEEQTPLFSASTIFLIAGLLTVPVAAYAFILLPQATLRFVVWLLSCTVYRVRVVGHDNLPETGGALLLPNHVSWLDGILLILTSSRPVRMVVYAEYIESGFMKFLAGIVGAIPIRPGQKRSVVDAIRQGRQALANGELVCVFPEGQLTRSGQLQSFQPGFLSFLKDSQAPVVPVYLDELWGSIFSFQGGRFFWKWPRHWPYPVTILFGQPLAGVTDPLVARQAVQILSVEAAKMRKDRQLIPPRRFIRRCRATLRRKRVVDSTGAEFTGGTLLLRSLILRRLLRRGVLAQDERFVGLLVPTSAGAVLANAALALDSRVAVNLNYTASADVMNSCIRQCGIKHVITSRKAMQKFNVQLDAEMVYLEDFKDSVTTADKLAAATMTYALPAFVTERLLGLTKVSPDDLLTVIFTSGSTGEPKGVMLSHYNISSNVDAISQSVQLRADDVLLCSIPLFHSLGYTTTMWTVLMLEPTGAYHFSPLDAHELGKLCRRHHGTIIITAPTFLRSYLRRCDPEDFKTLEVAVAGAEKLPTELCDAFETKFGVRPVEGYGTTELSPLVAVNIPASRAPQRAGDADVVAKEGTVGRPIPGVAAKIVDPDSGAVLGTDTPGQLWVTGPNVMLGYYNRPDLTSRVIRDGWYNTGDIALIDADGFIKITGRESRFSKLGGEMVPHVRIEEVMQKVVAAGEDEIRLVVTAVPDARKGERIVVLHTQLDKTPAEIIKGLTEAGLPNLWIPSADSFMQVDTIPLLGSGKLDLKAVKNLAIEKFAAAAG